MKEDGFGECSSFILPPSSFFELWMWESLVQSAGLGRRRSLVRIQPSRLGDQESGIRNLQRKGKPMGDGTEFEPRRAMSLEGSTPSPSAVERMKSEG